MFSKHHPSGERILLCILLMIACGKLLVHIRCSEHVYSLCRCHRTSWHARGLVREFSAVDAAPRYFYEGGMTNVLLISFELYAKPYEKVSVIAFSCAMLGNHYSYLVGIIFTVLIGYRSGSSDTELHIRVWTAGTLDGVVFALFLFSCSISQYRDLRCSLVHRVVTNNS